MTWRKSSYCDSNTCIWVDIQPGYVLIQDDTGATLRFTHDEWAAFLAGVRNGEFDIEADHG